MPTKTFRELLVWQKARALGIEIYQATRMLPDSERYGLASQMQRSAISVSSNIAESYNRFHKKEKAQFLAIAFGSCSELESQIEMAKTLFPALSFEKAVSMLDEVSRMLNKLTRHSSF